MSIYFVAQWSVNPKDVIACEDQLEVLSAHMRHCHPDTTLGVRVFRQQWGPHPRRAYMWMQEYASLAAMEEEMHGGTVECGLMWGLIERLAMPGTYICSVWGDPNHKAWFKRTKSGKAIPAPRKTRRKKT